MPTVRRFNRCRIERYFGDHPPPHFHVVTRSDEAAVFLIETLAHWAGEADPRDTEEAPWVPGSSTVVVVVKVPLAPVEASVTNSETT
jgi:hypothetical protein